MSHSYTEDDRLPPIPGLDMPLYKHDERWRARALRAYELRLLELDGRQVCTPARRWTKDASGHWLHPAATEIGTCIDDCCQIMRCPTCEHEWRQELPE